MEFDKWWIVAIVAGGLVFAAYGMWLEHKRKEKALDIMRDALAAGREVPPGLLEGALKNKDDDWTGMGSNSGGGWTGVTFFLILCAGFGIAAWYRDGFDWSPFWLVSGIMLAMAVMTGVSSLTRRGRD